MRKPILEQCDRLHIGDVRAAIPNQAIGAVLQVGSQAIKVVGRVTNLKNGYRYFFLCADCQELFESLYSTDFGHFKCRNCLGLMYASSAKVSQEQM
ncbi:hypothetical protein AUJ46_01080 [Candidatus Peregrinibacteria bacterium CG1_02_54_53]|nr:MAG: hypothetical protein AUJ46_01080 [Candidatus Peregrinibacteria bacterium CG1_02_54_53]